MDAVQGPVWQVSLMLTAGREVRRIGIRVMDMLRYNRGSDWRE